ncbi:hypothetical protein GCM10027059_40100 [Myceligenerans halotolerans]
MTRLAVVAVGALVAVAGVSATASADELDEGVYSTLFWDGGGALTDDFGDHYGEIGNSLCNGCANSWDTQGVRAWQAILIAEGLLQRGQADGKFGSDTETATWNYQNRYDLGTDGQVGPQTWGHADGRLRWNSSSTWVMYNGSRGYVQFERGNSAHGNAGGSGAYRIFRVCVSNYCEGFGNSRIYH